MRDILAFSVSGNYFSFAIVSERGIISYEKSIELHGVQTGEDILQNIKKYGTEILNQKNVSGIAISTAGQVDDQKGVIVYSDEHLSKYTGTEIKKELESYFNMMVEVENNVNCLGLATAWIGPNKANDSIFLLTFGNGIGGSYVMNGKLHVGHTFSAGEIGYIRLGNQKLGDYISFSDIIKRISAKNTKGEKELTIEQVFSRSAGGDEACKLEIEAMVSSIAQAISIVCYVINPQCVLLSGEITRFKTYLEPLIHEKLSKELQQYIYKKTEIAWLDNSKESRLIGATRHFLLQESQKTQKKLVLIIEQNRNLLTKREHILADFIIEHMLEVPQLTITEMANRVKSSDATITRFCQKIKIGSYNQLKMLATLASTSTLLTKNTSNTLQAVRERQEIMLNHFDEMLNVEKVIVILEGLKKADKVFIVGLPKHRFSINVWIEMLLKNGILALNFTDDIESLENVMSEQSVILLFSDTGDEPDLVDVSRRYKNGGQKVFSLSAQADCLIAQSSDIYLQILRDITMNNQWELLYLSEVMEKLFK